MNSRISAGSTVVDGGVCQPNSPLRKVRRRTVKKPEQNLTARLTFIEPYQRKKLSHRRLAASEKQKQRATAVGSGERLCENWFMD